VTNGFFIIDIKDIRIDEQLYPMGVNLLKDISSLINLNFKEIVTIVPDNLESSVEIIKKRFFA
jgi:hypothetical protein